MDPGWIPAPKKRNDFETLFKNNFTGKITSDQFEKYVDKSQLQLWCSHSKTICDVQLQRTIILRMQLRHRATLTQPLQCDHQLQLTNRISAPKQKKIEALFRRNFKRKITSAKTEKTCWQITIAALMQSPQYDLQCPSAKGKKITHAKKP